MAPETRPTVAVILAAGKGTRMKSELPKVLHPILGKPMVSYIVDACRKAGVERTILVIGHKADLVRETLGPDHEYVEQGQQLGTGHALLTASESLKDFKGDILVLAGDTPLLTGNILKKLIKKHKTKNASATMMTAVIDPPPAYGRVIRDESGRILRIVEDRDATREEKAVTEVNTSHYCFSAEKILPLLSSLDTRNDQGEYYLTDVIHLLARRNETIETVASDDPNVLMGINSRKDLSQVSKLLKNQILEKWMERGVTVIDPESVHIEADVTIGRDTTIHPFTSLEGRTRIGQHCRIGPQVRLTDAKIGDECRVEFSVIEKRTLKEGSTIGPLACITGE